VNEIDANLDAQSKSSGTGGFALVGRTTIPVFDNLNTKEGRAKAGVPDSVLAQTTIYPLRVKAGEEASCLNLNHAQRPRILGVPKAFRERGGFTFSGIRPGTGQRRYIWNEVLETESKFARKPEDDIPAVVDSQSMQWALGLSLNSTLDVQDEQGHTRHVRLLGALANSILQGSILISEEDFLRLYPSESGYRMFLIDTPPDKAQLVAKDLAKALADEGFEAQSAAARLAEYNAVANTYLSTFQALGAFGVLLGSLGLGIVALRNMLERRSELAMLRALGFSDANIGWMILVEHGWILGLGLAAGLLTAIAAVAPTVKLTGAAIPWTTMALTLGGIAACGLISALAATFVSLRAPLIEGLRAD